jgi:hypothetical protein
MGMKKADQGLATNRSLALAGVITGAVGIVVNVVILILGATGVIHLPAGSYNPGNN